MRTICAPSPKRCRATLATALQKGAIFGVRRQSEATTALWGAARHHGDPTRRFEVEDFAKQIANLLGPRCRRCSARRRRFGHRYCQLLNQFALALVVKPKFVRPRSDGSLFGAPRTSCEELLILAVNKIDIGHTLAAGLPGDRRLAGLSPAGTGLGSARRTTPVSVSRLAGSAVVPSFGDIEVELRSQPKTKTLASVRPITATHGIRLANGCCLLSGNMAALKSAVGQGARSSLQHGQFAVQS